MSDVESADLLEVHALHISIFSETCMQTATGKDRSQKQVV
jgi:hypothetical protein